MTSQTPAISKSQHHRNYHHQQHQQQQRHHQQWLKPQHIIAVLSFGALAVLLGTMPCSDAFDINNEMKLKPVQYTDYRHRNGTYISSTEYNARGMQPLYEIANAVIISITGDDALPEGYITINNMDVEYGPKVRNNEWIDLIKHYWAILLVVILFGLLIVVMPIIGFCFCCCRCAGACGGRSEPFDKKHDTCRRVFLGFLLILLATGILFGVIAAFVTTVQMESGIKDSTVSVAHGGSDTRAFLATTTEEVNHTLVVNYKQLSDQLKNILRETLPYIVTQLERKSSAISLIYLTDFLSKLPDIREKLQMMRTITNELRVHASQLSDGLRGVKRDLLVMLTKCNVQACVDVLVKYEIGTLDANGIHYDQLPDVTAIIDNLEKLINDNIASVGNRGRDVLNAVRANLKDTIAKSTPKVVEAIDQAGDVLKKVAAEVTVTLERISKVVDNKTNRYTEIGNIYIDVFNPYRYYTTIAVCALLLIILFCLTLALFCGICGKRPGGYGDDCCNKGAGSRFLMIAVTLIFLFISLIAVIALLHFLLGVVAYRGICMPLKDPQNDSIFAEIDSSIDLNELLYPSPSKGATASGTLPPFRISHVIAACQAGQSIYEVLRIHNRKDINEIKENPPQYKINQTLENLVNEIDFDNSDVQILSPADKERLLELGKSALKDYSSGQFIDNLNETITKHSLKEIANQLRQTANKITSPDLKDVQVGLRNQALHLETYEQNLVIPMKKQASDLILLAHQLDEILRYKEHSFQDSIPLLVNEIEKAQTFMNDEGRPFVKAAALNLSRYFSSEIDRYLTMVVNAVEKKIGLCHPMSKVYDAGIVAGCSRLVNPINGFWLAVFWCVLLFIPTLIVAIKLAGLYQKSDPYPGPLVESEYLYDAYSERDHIPLANGPKNKRRKNKDRRRREYYEEAVGAAAQPPPVAGPAGGRDTRYSDMAPKHWDGGPPRYQNPPMAPPASEYERPPPYYYPGASDQD